MVQDAVAAYLRSRYPAVWDNEASNYDRSLFESGVVDSFGVLELIAFLEDTFDIAIDTGRHELIEFDTVNKIAALVARVREAPR
jgi:acyl carrier protein